MRSRFTSAAIVALLLSGCASVDPSSSTTAAAPSATSSIPESPQPSSAPTPPPSSTASPSADLTPEATSTPFGAAVFADPDDCTNEIDGYRVAYPNDWYSNASAADPLGQSEGVPACQYFAPTEFAVVYGTEPSPEIAISIDVFELPDGVADYNYGPFEGYAVRSDSAATVGGYPARVLQVEVTQPVGYNQVGDLYTKYVVELPGRQFLTARTRGGQEDDATSRQVLSEMMQTLEVLSR